MKALNNLKRKSIKFSKIKIKIFSLQAWHVSFAFTKESQWSLTTTHISIFNSFFMPLCWVSWREKQSLWHLKHQSTQKVDCPKHPKSCTIVTLKKYKTWTSEHFKYHCFLSWSTPLTCTHVKSLFMSIYYFISIFLKLVPIRAPLILEIPVH